MVLAAGAIHLGQVGIHLSEGWMFVAFFLTVGVIQLFAAPLLLATRAVGWFRFGVVGSGLIIAIWIMSRWLGLPFGAEPGRPEDLGTADAAATLAEAVTIVALGLWLRLRSRPQDRLALYIAAGLVLAMGALWLGARIAGIFDPDPRLTGGTPDLADRVALAVVIGVCSMLVLLVVAPGSRSANWWRRLMRGILTAVVICSVALVVVTLPARGGQNADCEYGPLAEVSGLSHAGLPPPVALVPDQPRWLPILVLSACRGNSVQVTGIEPLHTRGEGGRIVEVGVLPAGQQVPAAGVDEPPQGSQPIGDRPVIVAGQARQVVVLVRGAEGTFNLDAVQVHYLVADTPGQFNFATFLGICSPDACASDRPAG